MGSRFEKDEARTTNRLKRPGNPASPGREIGGAHRRKWLPLCRARAAGSQAFREDEKRFGEVRSFLENENTSWG